MSIAPILHQLFINTDVKRCAINIETLTLRDDAYKPVRHNYFITNTNE